MNNALKQFRKKNNLTQSEMAKDMGFSLSLYEKIERGNIKASRNFIDTFIDKYPEVDVRKIFFAK